MENSINSANINLLARHGCITKMLSPSTLLVSSTYWDNSKQESFDSMLTKKADGSGWLEIVVEGGTLRPIADPLHLESLLHFLNY